MAKDRFQSIGVQDALAVDNKVGAVGVAQREHRDRFGGENLGLLALIDPQHFAGSD